VILPPEPVSLSTASILKILLPEGAFCDEKELPESHRNGKPGELRRNEKWACKEAEKECDGRKNMNALREQKSRKRRGKILKMEETGEEQEGRNTC